ncbi:MAG TPA: LemA family protein [Candidatus Acidoferrum sp.]|jgi:LemA protein|nr:LemA family protein [Candidatus Acidoferrum sp.]
MKTGIVILVILLILALVLGSAYVGRRNQMAIKREAVNAAWSQVDVVLQRRADLIPNLVETVKGYAVQEQVVYGEIARARSALLGASTPAEKIAANGQLDSALGRLLVIVENYPQLKSNENFMRLQDELAGTENRIAIERRNYNQAVQDYNTYISLFPNSLIASMAGFTRNDAYFKTDAGARQAPKVNFDYPKNPGAETAAPAKPAPTPAPAHP